MLWIMTEIVIELSNVLGVPAQQFRDVNVQVSATVLCILARILTKLFNVFEVAARKFWDCNAQVSVNVLWIRTRVVIELSKVLDSSIIEGRDPQGVVWNKQASSYWPPFARKVTKPLTRGLDIRRGTTSNWRAGFNGIDLGYTAEDLLRMAVHRPSSGKDIQAVAFAISSAVQPGR